MERGRRARALVASLRNARGIAAAIIIARMERGRRARTLAASLCSARRASLVEYEAPAEEEKNRDPTVHSTIEDDGEYEGMNAAALAAAKLDVLTENNKSHDNDESYGEHLDAYIDDCKTFTAQTYHDINSMGYMHFDEEEGREETMEVEGEGGHEEGHQGGKQE